MTQSIASIVVGTYDGTAPVKSIALQEIEQKAQFAQQEDERRQKVTEQLKQYYKLALQQGEWHAKFTKVDGTESEMICTLDPSIIGEAEAKATRAPNPDLLHVYSTDRQGWRSMRVRNIKSICPHIL